MYYVYILACKDGTLYTGMTNDLDRRLASHESGRGGRYTRSRGVSGYAYTELRRTRGHALRREAAIKKLSRAKKLALITASRFGHEACYDSGITNKLISMAKGNNSQRKEKKKPKKDKKK